MVGVGLGRDLGPDQQARQIVGRGRGRKASGQTLDPHGKQGSGDGGIAQGSLDTSGEGLVVHARLAHLGTQDGALANSGEQFAGHESPKARDPSASGADPFAVGAGGDDHRIVGCVQAEDLGLLTADHVLKAAVLEHGDPGHDGDVRRVFGTGHASRQVGDAGGAGQIGHFTPPAPRPGHAADQDGHTVVQPAARDLGQHAVELVRRKAAGAARVGAAVQHRAALGDPHDAKIAGAPIDPDQSGR